MNAKSTRNILLGTVGLLALAIYVLACTSFSPDDTKVLYPAFDPSGAVGMALYDREAHRSEMLFVPTVFEDGPTNGVAPRLVRGQWLADGRNILCTWAGGKDDDGLNLALLPWGARGPTRLFRVPGKDLAPMLMLPLCVEGERIFLMADSKALVRLDLKTGALVSHEFEDAAESLSVYPGPGGAGVFYVESQRQPANRAVFGRLNPENFSRTPLMTLTNEIAEQSFFAFDREGQTVAFVEKAEDTARVVVVQRGRPILARPLAPKGMKIAFGSAGFSPKGDFLWATFQKATGTNTASYGFMEIPLSQAPIRETTLLAAAPQTDDMYAFYFQGGLSHDGKTAAVASTYLACVGDEFKPEDCALFFIDLSSPSRKVTRVPIPLPAKRASFK